MAKHEIKDGGKSTFGQKDGAARTGGYDGKHRQPETTTMDVPPRGQGVTVDDHKRGK